MSTFRKSESCFYQKVRYYEFKIVLTQSHATPFSIAPINPLVHKCNGTYSIPSCFCYQVDYIIVIAIYPDQRKKTAVIAESATSLSLGLRAAEIRPEPVTRASQLLDLILQNTIAVKNILTK